MLEHLNSADKDPSRVVVIGAGGFVGGAIARRVEAAGIGLLPLGRRECDLLNGDAAERLAAALL
jgi:nucleoside-diphosphate-sugar epimerase